MKVAAIDCGTNTIKLLIVDLSDGTRFVLESRMVRLGQGVDATGMLASEALARAFAAIDEYAALIQAHQVDRIRFCATSATRDAANAEVFTQGVRDRLGVDPEVIAGEEEARLSFDGAVRNLATTPSDPVLVVDIGGGSTETILGADGEVVIGFSMDIGSVRLHERHVRHDPITAEEIAAVNADVDAALAANPVDLSAARTVIGVAGTVTTITAGVLGLEFFDHTRIDQARMAVGDVQAQIRRLVALSVEQRRGLGYMHPGRADVIDAGALIWSRILDRTRVETVIASRSDILDGIAWSMDLHAG
ncbi:MAG: Ppx/GppA phosphatase family protein [Nocardioides sp.]